MSMERVAAAVERVSAALRRKPQAGIHDDSAASARWVGGLRTRVSHDEGYSALTDMPDPPLSGGTLVYLRRQSDVEFAEVDGGKTFHHVGSIYRVIWT